MCSYGPPRIQLRFRHWDSGTWRGVSKPEGKELSLSRCARGWNMGGPRGAAGHGGCLRLMAMELARSGMVAWAPAVGNGEGCEGSKHGILTELNPKDWLGERWSREPTPKERRGKEWIGAMGCGGRGNWYVRKRPRAIDLISKFEIGWANGTSNRPWEVKGGQPSISDSCRRCAMAWVIGGWSDLIMQACGTKLWLEN